MPHFQLSVQTWNQLRMIMNEKVLTHKPTHRVALRDKGINSVMGFKKTNRHGEHKLINTISTLSGVLFHTEMWCDFDKFMNVFVCLSQLRDGGSVRKRAERTTRCWPFLCFPVTKSFLCRTVRDDHQPPMEVVILLVNLSSTSHVGNRPAFTSPLLIFIQNISMASEAGGVAGEFWKAAVADGEEKFPTLTSSLSNPKLVQILKLDCSVSVLWPEPSCDLNTEELTQIPTVYLSLFLSLCVS